ncbi:Folylpolyglutamate synthase [Phytophthora citrophthora]|uniref:tetrahydrofolate synthase n=1 Tax=Phytophthora citrophthora TaxID=4793 RepID=A0AAD9GBL1_9STRA|nr:Folylpolyglutamate synthase [Phytophthora citrophthora]
MTPTAVAEALPPVKVAPSSASSATSAPSSPMSSASSGSDLSHQVQAALNRLLGVSSAFKDLQPGKDKQVSTREETIDMMQHYLKRLKMDDVVDSSSPRGLSVIHVAGTKGKGSTCAMVERILRQAGYKTGLFTSPHLVSPCERFRINGKPIADDVFLRHFNAVWDGLESTQDQSGPYPPMAWFFRFLTLMALHVFAAEQVDVVVLEVGLGGRLDATNVFHKPVVCGISTLDLDHTHVLGKTLDLIAYAKAGIFKPGVPAFTTTQEPVAMQMVEKCAAETGTPLVCVPNLDGFGPDGPSCKLGLHGDYQRTNAGLAVALAATWLRNKRGEDSTAPLDVSNVLEPVVKEGLKYAFWPGRAQLWEDPAHKMRFYIDGAHTLRSLECCADWFRQAAVRTTPVDKRVLIFTIHHERNVAQLFEPLLKQHYDRVYFCPTTSSRPSLAKVHTFSEALEIAGFKDVVSTYSSEELAALDDVNSEGHPWQTTLSRIWTGLKTHVIKEDQSKCVVAVKDSVVDCINELRALSEEAEASLIDGELTNGDQWDENWSVLVTGSLYLGGEALDFLGWQE